MSANSAPYKFTDNEKADLANLTRRVKLYALFRDAKQRFNELLADVETQISAITDVKAKKAFVVDLLNNDCNLHGPALRLPLASIKEFLPGGVYEHENPFTSRVTDKLDFEKNWKFTESIAEITDDLVNDDGKLDLAALDNYDGVFGKGTNGEQLVNFYTTVFCLSNKVAADFAGASDEDNGWRNAYRYHGDLIANRSAGSVLDHDKLIYRNVSPVYMERMYLVLKSSRLVR